MEYSNRTSSEAVCQMKYWSGQLITLNDLAAETIRVSPFWIAEFGPVKFASHGTGQGFRNTDLKAKTSDCRF